MTNDTSQIQSAENAGLKYVTFEWFCQKKSGCHAS